MLFTEPTFLFVFLPALLALYFLLPRRHRNLLLVVAMYFVSAEEGATALIAGNAVHEWTHDGRHLLGFPCH